MSETLLSNPIFHDEEAAREWLEAQIWAHGRFCPHCGVVDNSTLLQGKSHRPGLYQCNACREPFTVTVGTLYERSKIPLHKWLAATQLLMAGKKGISSLEISRLLGISKKSSWFLMHRIRESLPPKTLEPVGGEGKSVEADETFIGGKEKNRHRSQRAKARIGGSWGKESVFSLVEREGKVRSQHVASVSAETLRPILKGQIAADTAFFTDDAGQYRHMKRDFPKHQVVNHGIGEYVRGEAHTNTIEGYFSILKRGIVGTYHSVSAQHLKRYLGEFDYRYNEREALKVSDFERFQKSLPGIVGRRLTYRRTRGEQENRDQA
ncbi:MAG TPA: IS1595 family transposase [Stellaceae bacterium]|jgi:transposase-like protein|nr:IS1595 family transposase [Stellaceae bacterium]